jgi:hypothetical protein
MVLDFINKNIIPVIVHLYPTNISLRLFLYFNHQSLLSILYLNEKVFTGNIKLEYLLVIRTIFSTYLSCFLSTTLGPTVLLEVCGCNEIGSFCFVFLLDLAILLDYVEDLFFVSLSKTLSFKRF